MFFDKNDVKFHKLRRFKIIFTFFISKLKRKNKFEFALQQGHLHKLNETT